MSALAIRSNLLTWIAGLCLAGAAAGAHAAERLVLNFNPDWRFTKSDPAGAPSPDFDDRDWARVSTPHTFNDTDTFDDWSLPGHRGEQNQWCGRTWYRKTFTVPGSWSGRKVFIEFEAVRQVAEVYLNGQLLGVSKSGFSPFGFELTPHLRFGQTNVLAVMCDNRFMKDPFNSEGSLAQLSARVNETIPEAVDELRADQIPWNNPHWHPAHGGIYRNVRLYVTDPIHISLPLYSFLQTAGPYVYAQEVRDKSAAIGVEIPVRNGRATSQRIEVQAEVLDRDRKRVASWKHDGEVGAGTTVDFRLSGKLNDPFLWEPEYPYLYRVVCSVRVAGQAVDSVEVPLGIRAVRWEASSGFFINGRHLKLRGWGQKPTDEWPGLGAAQPDWMHFFTLDLMKEAGGNFVRWGHCLAGPAQISACDQLGLIVGQPGVDGESDTVRAAWRLRADTFRDTVIYFRNNPSILIWEGGNQKVTREHAGELRRLVGEYDAHGGRAFAFRRADRITAEFMDVGIGTEGGREVEALPVVEGEYNREESPRRVWDSYSPPNFGYPEAKGQTYQLTSEQYAVNQVEQYLRKLGTANHCGGANWIFSDSTSGGRVDCEVARASGEVDGVRLPKEAYYVCQTMFRDQPQVHIIGHWTYPAGTRKTVFVTSNCDEVELYVNGRTLGKAPASSRGLFTFPDVAFSTGEIRAAGYAKGKVVASQSKRSAGEPVALRLTPIVGPGGWQADGSDVLLLDVEAVDAKGERCPTVQPRVDFELSGPGVWRGGYNSGWTNSINHSRLDLECGINRVAVRATREAGRVTILARSAGLKDARIQINTRHVKVADGCAAALPALPEVALPKQVPEWYGRAAASNRPPIMTPGSGMPGRFTQALFYSGPTTVVHLEQDARNGRKVYVDQEVAFANLPLELTGADWVQAANRDSRYSAVDLMELQVRSGSVVTVAHDNGLPRPGWLLRQFQPSNLELRVGGRAMRLFQRRVDREESLTLGTNAEGNRTQTANMYLVFIHAAEPGR